MTIESFAIHYPYTIKATSYKDGTPALFASHPDLPGCMVDVPLGNNRARAIRELLQELRTAREVHIASLRRRGLPVPRPQAEINRVVSLAAAPSTASSGAIMLGGSSDYLVIEAKRYDPSRFSRLPETAMAGKKSIHVVPKGAQWAVKREGSKAPLSEHRTQAAAERAGRPVAKRDQVELVTHRKDGTIRDSDSYGNDPRRSKDTKH